MTGHVQRGGRWRLATVLAVKNNIAPPTIGYEVPDPECDLDYVPNVKRETVIDTALSSLWALRLTLHSTKYEE